MRVIKLIYKWILFSVIIQVLILTYINFFFLGGKKTLEVTNYQAIGTKTDFSVDIPEHSKMIRGSFDSTLIGCISEGKLVVKETQANREKKTIADDEGLVDYYRWLPDRNMVIYSIVVNSEGSSKVKLGTYDFDSDLEKTSLKISNLPENSEVTSIELSPLTNIIYVKVKTSETRSRVYKFDIMDNLSYIMSMNPAIDIKETNYVDSFLYQNEDDKILIRKGRTKSTKQVPLRGRLALLDIDSSDKLYAGALNSDGKITKISIGRPDENLNYTFTELHLKKPADKENLKITGDGKIFLIDTVERKIKGVGNSGNYSYSGDLVQILNKNIITYKNGKVKVEPLS